MASVKYYGFADLYDPDRPAGEGSTVSKIDPVALQHKTTSNTMLKVDSLLHYLD